MKLVLCGIPILIMLVSVLPAANSPDSLASTQNDYPNVFIDCRSCDTDYIRTEITFINYVIDRKDADIHILITRERTASNGREYTLTFYGEKRFNGINDTLSYTTFQDDTEDLIRQKMVHYLKLGLIRYMARTPMAGNLSINYRSAAKKEKIEDDWDYWVFRASLNSFFNGEKTYNSRYFNFRFRIDRITEDWKIRFRLGANYSEDNFDYGGQTLSSYTRGQNISALVIKSLNDHWSTGIKSLAYTSTYANIDRSISLFPALEYNVFPYSDFTRRELRLLYRLGYSYSVYNEVTIYDKTEEGRFSESLEIVLELKQPWGSVETSLQGSHYFFDFSKNSLTFYSELSLRLFKGFSLNLRGSYSMIHNQLSLQKSDIRPEEVLLRRKQLETQYSYWGSIGISYTFGSIYNNIVNPRFGN